MTVSSVMQTMYLNVLLIREKKKKSEKSCLLGAAIAINLKVSRDRKCPCITSVFKELKCQPSSLEHLKQQLIGTGTFSIQLLERNL